MKKIPLELPTLDVTWEKELASFVAINGYKLCQNFVKDGNFEYVITDGNGNRIITFKTKRNINFGTRRSRIRKRR